jgi:lipopolysaccharide transport system ATP-binding protein
MKPAIEIRNLGKEYKIAASQRYVALRDVLAGSVKNLFSPSKNKSEKFWALKDINLDIMPGERVGIIGRNGAGKSTLLKIISRITPPTTGEATIRGRVGSLLEVGTGFHHELTGRENIYLNGSILGLKKNEINKQLDAIIDFSGVEKFIDTPLKHFSSGMQLRLAFAVAAHLEPEILLIDEVLAVGDAEFQKKCIGKMEEVSKEHGRTIVFVSHNMSYITGLCKKTLLINKGEIASYGNTLEVMTNYLKSFENNNLITNIVATETVSLRKIKTKDNNGNYKNNFRADEMIGIEMEYSVDKSGKTLWLGYNLTNEHGINIFDTHSVLTDLYNTPHNQGIYIAIAWVPGNLLNTGLFTIGCAIFNHSESKIYFQNKEACLFNVYDSNDILTAKGKSPGNFPGTIRPLLNWTISKL